MPWADESQTCGGIPEFDHRDVITYTLQPDERRAHRYLITASADIEHDSGKHVGLVRDLSATGMFVYSNFRPSCGDELQLQIGLWNLGAEKIAITCRGKVVRVEQPASGAAIGIAISISGYQLHVASAETPN